MATYAVGSTDLTASVPTLRARAKATSIHSLKSDHDEKLWSVRFMASFVVSGVTDSQLWKPEPHCWFRTASVPYWSFSQARICVSEESERSKSQKAERSAIP